MTKIYQQHRFHVLDGMRGIAAVLVMTYHYYLPRNMPCFKLTYMAVDFFFVLSGFVLYHSYAVRLINDMSASEYAARRIGRLYPMMMLGVVIGTVFIFLDPPADAPPHFANNIIFASLCNLLGLPYFAKDDVFAPDYPLFPTDNPLWSIFFEMVASLGFLFLVRLQQRSLIRLCALAFTAVLLGSIGRGLTEPKFALDLASGWGNTNFLGGFPRVFYSFSLGMILAQMHQGQMIYGFQKPFMKLPKYPPIILYMALAALLLFPLGLMGASRLLTLLVFTPLLVLLGARSVCRNKIIEQISAFLGWASFPIYCLHVPIMTGIAYLWKQPSYSFLFGHMPQEMIGLGATMLAVLVFGYVFEAMKIQAHTTRFARQLIQSF